MKAIKPILPTLRDTKRYLSYHITTEDHTLTPNTTREALKNALLTFLGINTYAKAGIMLVKNTATQGIIKINRAFVDHVKTALLMITHINHQPVIVSSTRVSGMISNVKH